MQILWSAVYLIVLRFYFRQCSDPMRRLMRLWPFFGILVFVFVSAFWSQDVALTIRRSIALFLTFVFGVYFASRFDGKEQFRLLAWAFAICMVFSFAFELLGLNPSQEIPGWYGVFYHKTALGRNCTLGALIYLYWRQIDSKYRSLALLGFLASLALVLLSRDVTSLVTLALLLFTGPCLRRVMRWGATRAVLGALVLLSVGVSLLFFVLRHLDSVTRLLGKDPMLTGRVPVWILAAAMAMRRPWLGYGFDAFWLPDNVYVQRIWFLAHWKPPHAHNGLLELWLELGVVGLVLFLSMFVYYCGAALRLMRKSSIKVAAWPFVFFLFLFLANLTESFFISANSIYFFLLVACASMCRKGLLTENVDGPAYV
jgi:exopolysaccharide production protein ExoQ